MQWLLSRICFPISVYFHLQYITVLFILVKHAWKLELSLRKLWCLLFSAYVYLEVHIRNVTILLFLPEFSSSFAVCLPGNVALWLNSGKIWSPREEGFQEGGWTRMLISTSDCSSPLQILYHTHEGIQSPDILPDFAAPQGIESYARYGQRLRIKKSNTEREKVSIRKKASTDPNPTDEDWRQKRSDRMIGRFTISRDCYWRSMSSKRTWWNRGREKCQNLQRATQRGGRSRNFYKAAFVTVNISYDLLPVKQQRIFASPSC